MLGLVSAFGFAVATADKMRQYAHLGIERRCSHFEIADIIAGTKIAALVLGYENGVTFDSIVGNLIF